MRRITLCRWRLSIHSTGIIDLCNTRSSKVERRNSCRYSNKGTRNREFNWPVKNCLCKMHYDVSFVYACMCRHPPISFPSRFNQKKPTAAIPRKFSGIKYTISVVLTSILFVQLRKELQKFNHALISKRILELVSSYLTFGEMRKTILFLCDLCAKIWTQ